MARPADAVYLVLSEPYLEILNHAPGAAPRLCLPEGPHPHGPALLRTPELPNVCGPEASPAARHPAVWRVLPARDAAALYGCHAGQETDVQGPPAAPGRRAISRRSGTTATTDADGQPDWLLHYTPGPKARAEYAAFLRQPGAEAAAALVPPADADQEEAAADGHPGVPRGDPRRGRPPVDHEATAPLAPRPQAPSSMPPPPTPEDGTIPPVDADAGPGPRPGARLLSALPRAHPGHARAQRTRAGGPAADAAWRGQGPVPGGLQRARRP